MKKLNRLLAMSLLGVAATGAQAQESWLGPIEDPTDPGSYTQYWKYDFVQNGVMFRICNSESRQLSIMNSEVIKAYYEGFSRYRPQEEPFIYYLGEYSGDVSLPPVVMHEGNEYRIYNVGYGAFANSQALTSVKLPESLEELRPGAFFNCSSLKTINLENVGYINLMSFANCKSLEYADLRNVKDLNILTFYGCSSLSEVQIGAQIDWIPLGTFMECKNLTSIRMCGDVPEKCAEDAFDETVYDKATLYVPALYIESYRKAPVWKQFKKIVPVGTGTEFAAATAQPEVSATAGGIRVEWGRPFTAEVYSMTGNKVFAGKAASDIDIELQKGLYIVRVYGRETSHTFKTAVK